MKDEFIDLKLAARVLGTTVDQIMGLCSLVDEPLVWRDEERGITRSVLTKIYRVIYASYA